MMKSEIIIRLERLREVMKREHLGAFIFPSTDPHSGEYVPDHWKGREWISGFDGSAGTAVVTLTSAALWTDSRYFIPAEQQLEGTGYQLMRQGVSETPSIAQWIGRQLDDSPIKEVGLDGMSNSCAFVETLIKELRSEGGLTVRTNFDPLRLIWQERPPIPGNVVSLHPLEFSGEDSRDKIRRIRQALRALHADGMLVSTLDDIAWTLNLRGTDVHCNPLFVSYLLIASNRVTLYINKVKLTPDVEDYLRSIQVEVQPYEEVTKGLDAYGEYNILIDPATLNYTLAQAVSCPKVVRAASPIPLLKAVKNTVEQDGFRQAMLRDGIALVKFLRGLQPAVEQGGQTEISLADRLEALRREQPLYKGCSFDTIVGYEEHGAIVHYEATEATDKPIAPRGIVLIDSGGQYLDGTTDVTRTIALGRPTDEQRLVYTLVLKGHIRLATAVFPEGTTGTQLDVLAREAMWAYGFNFLHGTGHGVGSYLCCHEGPHQIRMNHVPAPLQAGMTVTNEPGIYLEGLFGVRIENTMLITDYKTTPFGRFLRFEPLTLCPIDTSLVEVGMLSVEELQWLNGYHATVRERLSPYLSGDDLTWLKAATEPLSR